MAFMACRQNVAHVQGQHGPSEGRNLLFHLAHIGLPLGRLGHQPGNGAAVPGDHDGFTTLYVREEMGQMRFGIGCLDFTYGCNSDR